ncbi:MAG: ymgE [Verrucomicrobiales bacterium]|nr:ymgE [Verrucomicrobiales bacterium]
MSIIGVLLTGLVVGAIAKLLMPGKDPGGFIITMILGVLGAFVAHWIGTAMGWYRSGEPAGFIASIGGAVLLLLLYRLLVRGRRTRT